MNWMGIGEIDRLEEVEEKAEIFLDKLIEEREEADEKRRRLEKNMTILREVEEEERSSRFFFNKIKKARQSEIRAHGGDRKRVRGKGGNREEK